MDLDWELRKRVAEARALLDGLHAMRLSRLRMPWWFWRNRKLLQEADRMFRRLAVLDVEITDLINAIR